MERNVLVTKASATKVGEGVGGGGGRRAKNVSMLASNFCDFYCDAGLDPGHDFYFESDFDIQAESSPLIKKVRHLPTSKNPKTLESSVPALQPNQREPSTPLPPTRLPDRQISFNRANLASKKTSAVPKFIAKRTLTIQPQASHPIMQPKSAMESVFKNFAEKHSTLATKNSKRHKKSLQRNIEPNFDTIFSEDKPDAKVSPNAAFINQPDDKVNERAVDPLSETIHDSDCKFDRNPDANSNPNPNHVSTIKSDHTLAHNYPANSDSKSLDSQFDHEINYLANATTPPLSNFLSITEQTIDALLASDKYTKMAIAKAETNHDNQDSVEQGITIDQEHANRSLPISTNPLRLGLESSLVKENERNVLGSLVQCDRCGKIYKHRNCLIKHRWEHEEAWEMTKQFCQTKHQQVQLLEAAQVLTELMERKGSKLAEMNLLIDYSKYERPVLIKSDSDLDPIE